MQSLQDKGMASTRLAFSQPWSEAIDIFVPRFYVSIRATSVNEVGRQPATTSGSMHAADQVVVVAAVRLVLAL